MVYTYMWFSTPVIHMYTHTHVYTHVHTCTHLYFILAELLALLSIKLRWPLPLRLPCAAVVVVAGSVPGPVFTPPTVLLSTLLTAPLGLSSSRQLLQIRVRTCLRHRPDAG